jgi:hypothetical protein
VAQADGTKTPGSYTWRKEAVANGEETVVAIPPVVTPIEVQVAVGIVPIEVRHVRITIELVHGIFVRDAICVTTHRLFSGLNRVYDLVCRERPAPMISFLRRTLQHSPASRDLPSSHHKACGQIIRSRNLGFFICQF